MSIGNRIFSRIVSWKRLADVKLEKYQSQQCGGQQYGGQQNGGQQYGGHMPRFLSAPLLLFTELRLVGKDTRWSFPFDPSATPNKGQLDMGIRIHLLFIFLFMFIFLYIYLYIYDWSAWYLVSDFYAFKCGYVAPFMSASMKSLIAKFMGLEWGPSGADRTQVGPMLAPWILLSGVTQKTYHLSKPMTCASIAPRKYNTHKTHRRIEVTSLYFIIFHAKFSILVYLHRQQWGWTIVGTLVLTMDQRWVNQLCCLSVYFCIALEFNVPKITYDFSWWLLFDTNFDVWMLLPTDKSHIGSGWRTSWCSVALLL